MAARLKPHHQEEVKAKIQSGQLIQLLEKHALHGKKSKLHPTRVKCAEILLARTVPVLSAVDQTIHQPDDSLSEEQILERLAQLVTGSPELKGKLLALIMAQPPELSTETDPNRTAIAAPQHENKIEA